MLYVLFFVVCFGASIIGTLCGIGGGIIIKPVLDATGVLSVAATNFLSGCTVLAMTSYSVIKTKASGNSKMDMKIGLSLSAGAVFGGLLGKYLFSIIKGMSSNPDRVGGVQAICLIIVTFATLVCTLKKEKFKTYHVSNIFVSALISFILGIISSFLGIGGGPFNLIVLYIFFSFTTKIAVEYSLLIVFFAQLTSVLTYVVKGDMPEFKISILLCMVIGGIVGGIVGKIINKKIDDKTVDKLFIGLMVVIILINVYNAVTLL